MQKKTAWRKLWNQRWRPRSGCSGLINAKFLITITQVNLWIAWVIFIKNFAIIRPPQPLLGCHLWFHNFFHAAFFAWTATFFTVWLFWCRSSLPTQCCKVAEGFQGWLVDSIYIYKGENPLEMPWPRNVLCQRELCHNIRKLLVFWHFLLEKATWYQKYCSM